MLNFSSRLSNNFSFWLLINCRAQWNFSFLPKGDVARSLVVVEETRMFSQTRLLQSSISQLLEYNKLEVCLEGQLHSIESDRMSILLESQD